MSYRATATAIGNSKGLRLERALFREHPEFAEGEFEVDVIAPGRLLIRAEPRATGEEATDPVLDAFLGFLGQQMVNRPDLMAPLTASDQRRVGDLVEGVEVNEDEELGDDFELP
ncbi:MAG: type II toxin-antitoxin system PrlF family antitoxin [Gemmatimonadaceae bacterium]